MQQVHKIEKSFEKEEKEKKTIEKKKWWKTYLYATTLELRVDKEVVVYPVSYMR